MKEASITISTSELLMNIGIGAGLRYMWNVVNVLQFVVYFASWQVNMPPKAVIFV